jgi:hypothetical protein
VFENRILRIFVPKNDELTGSWKAETSSWAFIFAIKGNYDKKL